MFSEQNITLLQPEDELVARLLGGAHDLAGYLTAVSEALAAHYAATEAPGERALFIAVGPHFKHQFWLAGTSLLPGEQSAVEALTIAADPPAVQAGPVALALIYTVGASSASQEELRVPEAWRAVVESVGHSLQIDDIILALWSGTV